MYEHPQYLTPEGFKRNRLNPGKDAKDIARLKKQKKIRNEISARTARNASRSKPISDKAAKLIASALKNMMND